MTNAQNACNPMHHNFTGRKPSKAQILSKAKAFDQSGSDFVSITWGENWIDLEKDNNGYWHGYGFVRDISGEWIARELNHCPNKIFNAGFGNIDAQLSQLTIRRHDDYDEYGVNLNNSFNTK